MIAVYKTNVQEAAESELLIRKLLEHFPQSTISFDLEDCDRILRVKEHTICNDTVIALLAAHGYACEALL